MTTRKVELTRREVREWANLSLEILAPTFGSAHPKFTYAIAKNYNTQLLPEAESIKTAEDKDEGWQAYEEARIKLVKEHARKGPDGEPLIQGAVYLLEDRNVFDKELGKLQQSEEHAESYDRHEKMMDEKITLDIHTFPLSKIPERVAGPVTHLMLDAIEEDDE